MQAHAQVITAALCLVLHCFLSGGRTRQLDCSMMHNSALLLLLTNHTRYTMMKLCTAWHAAAAEGYLPS